MFFLIFFMGVQDYLGRDFGRSWGREDVVRMCDVIYPTSFLFIFYFHYFSKERDGNPCFANLQRLPCLGKSRLLKT